MKFRSAATPTQNLSKVPRVAIDYCYMKDDGDEEEEEAEGDVLDDEAPFFCMLDEYKYVEC